MQLLSENIANNDNANLIKQLADNLHVFYGIIGAIILINLVFMAFLYLKMRQDIKITLTQMSAMEKNTEYFFTALNELMKKIQHNYTNQKNE